MSGHEHSGTDVGWWGDAVPGLTRPHALLGPDATLEDWVTHRGLPAGTSITQLIEYERVTARGIDLHWVRAIRSVLRGAAPMTVAAVRSRLGDQLTTANGGGQEVAREDVEVILYALERAGLARCTSRKSRRHHARWQWNAS